MAELRELLTEAGFTEVQTYIQSGNVVLVSHLSADAVTRKLSTLLKKRFDYSQPILVLPAKEVKKVIKSAPKGFGTKPKLKKCDVMFLLKPATPAKVLNALPLREKIDEAQKGYRAIFFSRKADSLTKSYLSKVTALPEYQLMTVRNWNTTSKLLQLIAETEKKITA